MGLFIQIATLMLSLMFLVMLHELGHFLPAKWFGVRVERFFCFFDVKFAIWKKKIGDTVYGIGWLPLGGYVKLSGMIDESMDTEQMKQEPQPWEFRTKPAWQRLIIMLGGVTVNFILAIIIFTGLLLSNGENYLSVNKMTNGIQIDSVQTQMGLQMGDIPVGVDGVTYESLEDISKEAMLGGEVLDVKRSQQIIHLPISKENRAKMFELKGAYFAPYVPMVIDSVIANSSAEKAGIKIGDKIVNVNNKPINSIPVFNDLIVNAKGKTIQLQVERNKTLVNLDATISNEGKLGIGYNMDYAQSLFVTRDYSIGSALVRGVEKTIGSITTQVKGIKALTKVKDGRKQMAGPIGMVKQMPTQWNWTFFWSFTAIISAWLAFLNLLPIPALDGGHALFAIYEIITRRKPSEKILEKAQMVGVVILLGLMVFVFGNDILNAITG